MGHTHDWIDTHIEENPVASFRKNRTVGPKQPTSRGKRAIVLGAVSFDGIILESCKTFVSGKNTDGDYHRV
jgi:hypothetical protein